MLISHHYIYIGTNEENLQKAFKYYKLAANYNFIDAQKQIGECYLRGIGVEKHRDNAIKYLKLAADRDSSNSSSSDDNINNNTDKNNKNNKNINACSGNDNIGTNYGHVEAQNRLGRCYYDGVCVEKDKNKAVYYFRLSADQGYNEAQFRYARCLYEGIGINKNLSYAFKYFKLAADQGHIESQNRVANLYLDGITGIKKGSFSSSSCSKSNSIDDDDNNNIDIEDWNEKQALYYFTLASNNGYAESQNSLGLCYLEGVGTEKDYDLAFKYFNQASLQAYPDSYCNLALCYDKGKKIAIIRLMSE